MVSKKSSFAQVTLPAETWSYWKTIRHDGHPIRALPCKGKFSIADSDNYLKLIKTKTRIWGICEMQFPIGIY